MIEKIVLTYLNKNMSVTAYTERPEHPPKRYLIIEKTGGGKENHINSATIAIQSYAESLLLAAELNKELKDCMEMAAELEEICKVELNSDYNYTDTSTKEYRYQSVYDITHY